MRSVLHVVATAGFAGVERYVCDVANETAGRGTRVSVVGGHPTQMRARLDPCVAWRGGLSPIGALLSVVRLGGHDICHAHMTAAEAVAVAARPVHRGAVVATRHFAQRRGSTGAGRLAAPWIRAGLAREIAIGEFVARSVEHRPDAVIPNAVPPTTTLWKPTNRVVLVLQRLEREKDTLTALRAWQASRLSDDGWTLRVVGSGSERTRLQAYVRGAGIRCVEFEPWTDDVSGELARAAMVLAPAPAEPFGLTVLEAMAAGIPVVAAAAGGHLETVGRLRDAHLFAPGDHAAAAAELRALADDASRAAASTAARELARTAFRIERHVDALLKEYRRARESHRGAPVRAAGVPSP